MLPLVFFLRQRDPDLVEFLGRVVRTCATDLDCAEMVRYEPATGQLASTDRGRTASLFYIRYETAAMVKDALEPTMMIPQIFAMLSEASEFASMKVCVHYLNFTVLLFLLYMND